MRLKAILMFLVATCAFGQAPQTAPPAPTKSAMAPSSKGKEPAIRYMESGSGVVARKSRTALPAHSRWRGGTA